MTLPSRLFGMDVTVEDALGDQRPERDWGDEYQICDVRVGGVPFVAIEPAPGVSLPKMLNVVGGMRAATRRPCVLVSTGLTTYQKRRLCDRGVPWICSERSCYVPFLGIAG